MSLFVIRDMLFTCAEAFLPSNVALWNFHDGSVKASGGISSLSLETIALFLPRLSPFPSRSFFSVFSAFLPASWIVWGSVERIYCLLVSHIVFILSKYNEFTIACDIAKQLSHDNNYFQHALINYHYIINALI